jgi:hypothetical protein
VASLLPALFPPFENIFQTPKPLSMSITPVRVSPFKLVTDTSLTVVRNNAVLASQWERILAELQKQPCLLKPRRLKIVPHFRPVIRNRFVQDYKCIPKINLLGDWLHKAGFQIESHVQVYVMDKTLVIRTEE